MKAQFLRFHRWLTLLFSLPLLVLIVTGLILSFEPIVTANAIQPGSVTAERLSAIVERNDPDGRARMIAMRHTSNAMTIVGAGSGGRANVDLTTGKAVNANDATAAIFGTSRGLHEHLIFDAGWLVQVSTIAMLGLMTLGILMGLPKLRNTLAGWHKGIAWFLLPFLILSPLTGLGIAYGISLSGPVPAAANIASPPSLTAAIPIVAKEHDPSAILWLRKRGKRVLARVVQDGEYRVYAVTDTGTVAMPRNWSRLLHEGNGYGRITAIMNIIISTAMLALMGTGLYAWGRRKLRRWKTIAV